MENIENNTNLVELRGRRDELNRKHIELHETKGLNWSEDDVKDFQIRDKELTDLGKRIAELERREASVKAAQDQLKERNTVARGYGHADMDALPGSEVQLKTLGELFTDSPQYKAYREGRISYKGIVSTWDAYSDSNQYLEIKDQGGKLEYKGLEDANSLELKTMGINNSLSGFVPKNIRSDVVIPGPLQKPMVGDIIPSYTTTNNTTKWMKETTTTNNAAAQAEGAAAVSESVLVWTEQTAPLEKVSSWISVTQEQLDDVPNMQSLINDRMTYMHAVKEDYYLLNANATTPQIVGLNAAAMTGEQTQAAGTDPVFDAIMKGIVKVQTGATSLGLADPTHIVMNPNNWQTIALTTTADGIYIYGSPAAPLNTAPTLWGRPVITTTNQTANTAIVGDFARGVRLARRQEITLEVSDSHDVNFTKNIIVLKITSRFNLEHWIPAGFCFVTGLS